jgi:hypothetical protein
MTTNEVIVVIAVTFIAVGIPVTGLVVRFALRPLVQDIAAAIRGERKGGDLEIVERLERIETRLEEQDRRMGELLEASRFHRELEAGRPGEPERPSPER